MVEFVFRINHDVTLKRSTTVGGGHFQCVEPENILGSQSVFRLCTPKQLTVRRHNLLGNVGIDDFIDVSRVAHVGVAHECERALTSGLQNGEQRMLFLGLFNLLRVGGGSNLSALVLHLELRLRLCRVGLHLFHFLFGNLRGGVGTGGQPVVGHARVKLHEVGNDFLGVVGLPEFKVGRALQQLTHTLRLANTRHFHHDTAVLTFEFLDVGLHHAELVDTRANHVERVVDGRLYLGAQCALHFLVGALRRNLALQLLRGKNLGQTAVASVVFPSLDEERDEVVLAGFLFGLRLVHGFLKGGVGLVVGQHFYDIGNGDFQNHVHTTLQVESETDLRLQTVLIGVDTQILHRILVVLLFDGIFYFGGLLVIVARGCRERQIEDACQRQ